MTHGFVVAVGGHDGTWDVPCDVKEGCPAVIEGGLYALHGRVIRLWAFHGHEHEGRGCDSPFMAGGFPFFFSIQNGIKPECQSGSTLTVEIPVPRCESH